MKKKLLNNANSYLKDKNILLYSPINERWILKFFTQLKVFIFKYKTIKKMFKKSILVVVAVVFFCQSLAQDVNENEENEGEILNQFLTVGKNVNEILEISKFLENKLNGMKVCI